MSYVLSIRPSTTTRKLVIQNGDYVCNLWIEDSVEDSIGQCLFSRDSFVSFSRKAFGQLMAG